ncbi:MAG: AI-2E family transporter [Tissierellia bacterium]|nr:AI-2E family transporter [Tissierellia bacterium]
MNVRWKSLLRIGLTSFLLYLAIYYWPILSGFVTRFIHAAKALIIGGIFAYILNILMSIYEKFYFPKSKNPYVQKSRRGVCLFAAILTVALVIFILIRLIVPQLYDALAIIISEIPETIEKILSFIQNNEGLAKVVPENVEKMLASTDWKEFLSSTADMFFSGVGGALNSVFDLAKTILSGSVTFLLGLILALYILSDKERFAHQFHRLMDYYLPKSYAQKIRKVLTTMDKCFHAFITGQLLEAVILGSLCIGGMLIFRFPYATMIGTLIGFMNLIPVAGSFIGAAVGAFMILTVSPMKALLFLVFILVLQQIESNLIYPKVVGDSIGLPGLWVLAAITIGGGLFGVLGMLVSVPLTATVYRLLKEDLHKKEALALNNEIREEDRWKI